MVFDIAVKQLLDFRFLLSFDFRNQDFNNISFNFCQHRLFASEIVMLCRNYNAVDSHWFVVIRIFNCYLRFCIRTKVRNSSSFSSKICQFFKNLMSKIKCQRHIVFSFVGCITEHHSLISSTLSVCSGFEICFVQSSVYTLVDIRRLLVDCGNHTTRITIEHIFAFCVTNFVDDISCNLLNIKISFRLHFTSQNNLTCSHKCFTSYF